MNNFQLNDSQPTENDRSRSQPSESHPRGIAVGAVGGGVAGAAIGGAVAGKLGAAVAGVAGAIVGGMIGNSVAEMAVEVIDSVQPTLGLGANNKPIELPRHYTWEDLQALSKPQQGIEY